MPSIWFPICRFTIMEANSVWPAVAMSVASCSDTWSTFIALLLLKIRVNIGTKHGVFTLSINTFPAKTTLIVYPWGADQYPVSTISSFVTFASFLASSNIWQPIFISGVPEPISFTVLLGNIFRSLSPGMNLLSARLGLVLYTCLRASLRVSIVLPPDKSGQAVPGLAHIFFVPSSSEKIGGKKSVCRVNNITSLNGPGDKASTLYEIESDEAAGPSSVTSKVIWS